MHYSLLCSFLGFAIAFCQVALAAEDKLVVAEVEITRGEEVSELSVFIINNGPKDFSFRTGAKGAGDTVPEGRIAGGGSGLKTVPHLTFERAASVKAAYTRVHFKAPTFTSPQNRAMRDQIFVVPAGKRLLYYSFKVPSEYVRGEFKGGTLPLFDVASNKTKAPGYGQTSGYGGVEATATIKIARLVEASEKMPKTKRIEKP